MRLWSPRPSFRSYLSFAPATQMFDRRGVRKAMVNDAPAIAGLLVPYMRETYAGDWGGNEIQLARDIAEGQVTMFVAEASEKLIGFAGFVFTYDLHWRMQGADILDLYVAPGNRGHGIALQILAAVGAEVGAGGGVFLKGGAVENATVRKFYTRVTMMAGNGECYLSGRAFRHIAGLAGPSGIL